ncbi:hypothetical protein [Marivita sp. S2033]|uniref:hypothetical protein n=1 Tax=Marivita sp. S2033 TaxID=3373187 RepID=UPI003981B883
MKFAVYAGLLCAGVATSATPQVVRSCDTFEANARNLMFPVEQNTRSFANGDIRLIALDTGGEPVCCSAHLMVLFPAPEDPGGLCALISNDGSLGWAGILLEKATALYDPAIGLTVSVPVIEYIDGIQDTRLSIAVNVNQQSGVVTVRTDLP